LAQGLAAMLRLALAAALLRSTRDLPPTNREGSEDAVLLEKLQEALFVTLKPQGAPMSHGKEPSDIHDEQEVASFWNRNLAGTWEPGITRAALTEVLELHHTFMEANNVALAQGSELVIMATQLWSCLLTVPEEQWRGTENLAHLTLATFQGVLRTMGQKEKLASKSAEVREVLQFWIEALRRMEAGVGARFLSGLFRSTALGGNLGYKVGDLSDGGFDEMVTQTRQYRDFVFTLIRIRDDEGISEDLSEQGAWKTFSDEIASELRDGRSVKEAERVRD